MTHRSEPDRPICPERLVEHDRSCRATRGTETKTLEEATAASHAACSGHREQRRRQVKRERSHRQASKGTIPPYSVTAFKPHLKLHDNELRVLDEITENGSEIETLFVERAAQLVRPGGYAAIVLPSSILDKGTNSSFTAARDVMLRSFEIVAIARFGSGTFAATGTNVAIMFMRRFDEVPTRDASARDFVDAVFAGEDLGRWSDGQTLAAYLKLIDVTEDDYRAFVLRKRPWAAWSDIRHFGTYASSFPKAQAFKALKKTRAYKKADDETKAQKENEEFYRYAHAEERMRLRVFALVHGERTLVVNSPTATSEIAAFLGYKWSNRKGNEGIRLLDGGGVLYSDDPANSGEGTISGVIRSWFEGEEAEASDISQHYYYADVERFIDFDGEKFDMTLKMPRAFYRQREFTEGVSVCALGDVATYVTTGVPQTNIDVGSYVTTDNMVKNRGGINPYDGDAPASAGTAYEKGDTLVSNIRPYLQKIWLADHDGTCSKDVLVFRTKDESVLLPEFLYLLLWQKDFFDYDMSTFTGTGRPRGDKGQILGYRIPTPGTDEQCKLFAQFSHFTEEIGCLKAQIATSRTTVDAQFHEMFERKQKHWPTVRLIDCCRNQDDIKCGPFGTQLHKADYQAQGIPVWGIPEVNSGLSKAPTLFISPDKAATLNAYSVIQGDVVVSRKGNVGQAALFREGLEPGIIHSDVLRIRVNGAKLNPEYLVYYLHNSQEVKRQIEVVSPGSIMPGTNVTKLKSVAIVCPPIELQDAFAIFAQGADRKRAELQKRVDMLSQERELLLNQYLA